MFTPGEIVPARHWRIIPKGRPLILRSFEAEDIMEVSLGQETLIALNMDTRKDQALLGRVASVEKNSKVDDNFGRYFQVEIEFINPASNETVVPGVDGSASILWKTQCVGIRIRANDFIISWGTK